MFSLLLNLWFYLLVGLQFETLSRGYGLFPDTKTIWLVIGWLPLLLWVGFNFCVITLKTKKDEKSR